MVDTCGIVYGIGDPILNTKPKFCGDEEGKGLLLTFSSIVVV